MEPTFDNPLIFFKFVDWQMGQVGTFCNALAAAALLAAICSRVNGFLPLRLIFSSNVLLNILITSYAVSLVQLK